ncbi:YjeF N-terminal domain-containing protein [Phycomyces nitens]|nr:YjeF N-terminal domain-containing protein [Phycomyces nitens]
MAEEFIGLRVSLTLHSGVLIDGTVAEIAPSTHQMTLHKVSLVFPGQPALETPIYGVVGKDIKDLQVVSRHVAPPPSVEPPLVQPAVPIRSPGVHQSKSLETSTPFAGQETPREPREGRAKKNPKNEPSQSVSNTPRRSKKSNSKPEKDHGWAEEDVEEFRKKEFDFQANLSMFDKKRVFEEIRESDDTAPDTLLVSLNRLPQKEKSQVKTNLLNSEMVLEPASSSLSEDRDSDENTGDYLSSDIDDEVNGTDRRLKKGHAIVTVNGKIPCPPVSNELMDIVEKSAESLSGPGPSEILVENGGRSACLLALQIIDDQPSKSTYTAVVLAGNGFIGEYGLAAARHLINRGWKVIVSMFPVSTNSDLLESQLSMLSAVGASIVPSTDLEALCIDADLIMDSIFGVHKLNVNLGDPLYPSISRTIEWANNHSAPIISLRAPSGFSDKMHGFSRSIHPKCTLCLGVPTTDCVSPSVTGELYMADIGISRGFWKGIDMKTGNIPWGVEFLIPLEYKEL